MSMLRRLLGKGPEALTSEEEAALARLKASHGGLIIDSGRVSTKSEAGFNACAVFLDGLEAAAQSFRLDPAPRAYRTAFTINYRALFPDEARNYRVDVLEASVEQYAVIWVNGDKFEFSAEAMHRAEVLQGAWAELCSMLERWCQYPHQQLMANRPLRSEVRNVLVALDIAWASFEHKYIAELIEIEEKARRLIVQAIEHEHCLQLMEATHSDAGGVPLERSADYCEEQRRLVACIAHLNSVANFRRKGRDDLVVQVLHDAAAALRRCDEAERAGKSSEALAAARILATDVVESFEAMREYLREVERCLERVDPHLCNNAGLVARLVDWEESWEVGTRYVQHESLLHSVCDLVAEVRSAQRLAPALTAMCDDCDVELFLVLPRIIWLRFLALPMASTSLLQSLLPHRFPKGDDRTSTSPPDVLVTQFLDNYRHVRQLVLEAQTPPSGSQWSSGASDRAAFEVFLKRVIYGPTGKEDPYCSLCPDLRASVEASVETLMHELEKWSIELQRHCPEDWNQCSAILVQCLTGGNEKQKHGPFRV